MKDWSNFIEREVAEVLIELSDLGYQVESDEPGISTFRNIKLRKGDETIELVCSQMEPDVSEQENIAPEDEDWWIEDIYENGESFAEYADNA